MVRRGLTIAAVAIVMLIASQAMADTVVSTYLGMEAGTAGPTVSWKNLPGDAKFESGTYYTGPYAFNRDGGSYTGPGLPSTGKYIAVCVQMVDLVSPATYDVVSPSLVPDHGSAQQLDNADRSSLRRLELLENLFAQHWSEIWSAGANKNKYAAAFQLAAWEIIYETNTTKSLDSGSSTTFYAAPSDATTQANTWLAGLSADGTKMGLIGLRDGQDFVVPVPLPATAGMMFATLAVLGAVTSLRRRS
ncbi:MAG: hypothetical protein NTU53_10625 [Planctomycetota bacterium]|nr:hypothetical protein [Planctomycetota bacterium]